MNQPMNIVHTSGAAEPIKIEAGDRRFMVASQPTAAPYTLDEANAAALAWGFNCGPAAYGAIRGNKNLGEIADRFREAGFLAKGYTNPTMMRGLVRGVMRVSAEFTGSRPPALSWAYPSHGLVRIQWGGPWTKDGVPMPARYRHTHWIAVAGGWTFDVNCLCVGGWVKRQEWESQVAPWIIRQCVKKGDGSWWPTHLWEIARA